MTFAPLFTFFGALALLVGLLARDWIYKLFPLYFGMAYLAVAFAYSIRWPGIWLKRSDGRLPWLSWVCLAPVHAFVRLNLSSYVNGSGEAAFHEVVPGVFLGRILREQDIKLTESIKPQTVVDLTAEFSAASFFRQAPAYLCLPTLDTTAPTVEQIQRGVDFMAQRVGSGPVYVHCAFGHGRSAVLIVAWLLHTGRQTDIFAATDWVRSRRPGVSLNRAQFRALRVWFSQQKVRRHG